MLYEHKVQEDSFFCRMRKKVHKAISFIGAPGEYEKFQSQWWMSGGDHIEIHEVKHQINAQFVIPKESSPESFHNTFLRKP